MSLKGSTAEFPLDVLIRFLRDQKKTGELTLRSPKGEGALGLNEGRVVVAVFADESPIASLGEIFEMPASDFEFTPWDDAPPGNLEGDLDELLRKAREHREWMASVRQVIPTDRTRFRLSERAAEQGAVTFTPDRWRVVLAVNGERNVSDIASHLHIDRDSALNVLSGLVRDGVIDVVEAPSEPAPFVPPAPEPVRAPEPQYSAPPPPAPEPQAAAPVFEAPPPVFEAQPDRAQRPQIIDDPRPSLEWGTPPPPEPEVAPPPPMEIVQPVSPHEWTIPSTPEPPAAMPEPTPTMPEPLATMPEQAPAMREPEPPMREPEPAMPEPATPEPEPAIDDRLAALFGPAPSAPSETPAADWNTPAASTEWTTPAPAADQWTTPATDAPEAPAEQVVDPRLGALTMPPPPQPAAPAEQKPASPFGSGKTAALPNEWAPPPPVEAPPQKKGGGLFGFGRKKEQAAPAATPVAPSSGASRVGKLAAFSNALLSEYNSGQYGKARIDDRMPSLLMRVDEQADPIDRPLPVLDDRLDVEALDRVSLPEAQAAPYLAMLVTTIYADAEKAFGKDKAKKGYKNAQQLVFAGDPSALAGSDLAGKLPKV